MFTPILRDPCDNPPIYRPNSTFFTVELHYGGQFYDKPNNVVYEGGFVTFLDFFHAAWFTRGNFLKFLRIVDNIVRFKFYYRKQKMSIGMGLRKLEFEADIKEMLQDRIGHPVVVVYVVSMPLHGTYALPLHASNTFEDCYIPHMEENICEETENSWPNQFFHDIGGEDAWSQYEETLQYDGVGNIEVEEGDVGVGYQSEQQREEEGIECLIDSDYELDESDMATAEVENRSFNFDFGFGASDDQHVRDSDTDYGASDELHSIDSDEDTNVKSSNDPFNVRTDINDPVFKKGMTFESKAVLKAAITSHSVKSNREIKFKKDDAIRLRAKCKGDCPWMLYATKEHTNTNFVIKNCIIDHTCAMVYKNFRVSSTLLADKYLADWRAEPKMQVSTFMERVKRDGLGDISPWQVYRAKQLALKKIRGTVVEHYKLLWDYCEELKRTNDGTTAIVEGHVGEFKRLYICLGSLKEGFRRGCRQVIGVDGCFLKTEHGGQLLTAIGVDGNNGMYPVAYAVVEIENGDNWRWFLELLKDDLGMHNSHGWIFMSDKQKGLVNAIEALFEYSEHRTCVRHLYKNFSASHKGLALKNILWDAARATTVPQWSEHMKRMLELDPAAYKWLESKPASHWSKSHFKEWNKSDMLLNNLCESFNSTIVNARQKPILTMLEEIRVYLMKRIVGRRECCDRWNSAVGPRIQKILDKNSILARVEWAEYAGHEKFQVRHNLGSVLHVVDLRARTCTCRGWQLTGIPCSHVIASLVSRGLTVTDYVDPIYKNEAYLMTYTPSISPITGPDSWPDPGHNPLTPPFYTKKSGRPKKNRRKEPNEVGSSSQTKRARSTPDSTTGDHTASRRRGMVMTCTKCGQPGHNRRGCRGAPPPARS